MLTRRHQFQLDGPVSRKALSGSADSIKAAVEVGDEVLLEMTIASHVVGNSVVPALLRQPGLDGTRGAPVTTAGLGERQEDLECLPRRVSLS